MRYLPSRPANGELLTLKNIATVGSSTAVAAIPSGTAASAIVSPMFRPSMPETQMMSPADGFVDLDSFEPVKGEHLGEAQPGRHRSVAGDLRDQRVFTYRAAKDAADPDHGRCIVVVIDVRDEHLEPAVLGGGLGDLA